MPKHLIATNRTKFDLKANNKDMLGVDDSFKFGWIEFDPAKGIETDSFAPIDPGDSDYSTCLAADLESLKGYARFFCELYHQTKGTEKEVLVFIHGYRHAVCRMQETMRRLQKVYIDDPKCKIEHLVMISWPSTAETGDYEQDRERAIATGSGAFRTFLRELRFFLKQAFKNSSDAETFAGKLNLAVASMGNRLLQATGESLDFDGTQLFNEVIHTASDVDTHQFKPGRPLKRFSQLARRVHVHFNYGDLVLELSSEVVNDFERRLGHDGPALGTPRDPKINYINVSLAVSFAAMNPDIIAHPGDEREFPIVHCYFHKVKTVSDDAKKIFAHQDKFILRNDESERGSGSERGDNLALYKLIPEF